MEFTLEPGWESRYTLRVPPDLTEEIASRRWRDVNRLVLAPILLQDGADNGRPLLSILSTARTIVPAERGLLSLSGDAPGTLDIAAEFGFGRRVPERLRHANPLAAAAARCRKPVLVGRAGDLALARALRLLGRPSCLSVPILRRGAPWGVIQLARTEPFREDDAILAWLYALGLEGMIPGLLQCQGESPSRFAGLASGRSV